MKTSRSFLRILVALAAALLVTTMLPVATTDAAESKTTKTEKQLFQLEEELCAGYLRDVSIVERILADDYLIVVDDKPVRTKTDEVRDLKSGALKVTVLTAEGMTARVYGAAAVVTGIYTIKGVQNGQDISGRHRFTDTFIRQKGQWRLVSTHASSVK
jgi:hypothetical protein